MQVFSALIKRGCYLKWKLDILTIIVHKEEKRVSQFAIWLCHE